MYKLNKDLYPGKYKTYINSHKMNSTTAAIIIQRVWRKYIFDINSNKMNSTLSTNPSVRQGTSAAIIIQRAWRKYIFNKNSRSGSLISRFFSWFYI